MSEEKQIEEMAKAICEHYVKNGCGRCPDCFCEGDALKLYNAGYRKQRVGEWIIKGDYLKIMECSACGIMTASIHEKTRFCPNCGAKMGGGAE